MLALPQTAEYALRAVGYIAEHEGDGPVPVSEIAASLGAPQNYLSKTLHQLARAGVLRSVRGPRGGFQLAVPPGRLTLERVAAPFDEVGERHCLLGRAQCGDRYPCAAHARWTAVSDSLQAFFRNTTVADLMNDVTASARRSQLRGV